VKVLIDARNRVYSDFFQRSRLDAYERLLETALRVEYQVVSVGGLWRRRQAGVLGATERYLVLRHDIDTDSATARIMWTIDHRLGVETSYFFRLSTLDRELMTDIANGGSEASYHYEELASVAKRRRPRSRSDALRLLPEAKELFAANLARLRAMTGLPMTVVASHGDFVNRRLGLPNWMLLDDGELRRELAIELEAYDEAYLAHLTTRHADGPYPRHWYPLDPLTAIEAREPVISVLVHPRHWRVNRLVNARDNAQRVVEGLRLKLRV
jgi:hypothetical protein